MGSRIVVMVDVLFKYLLKVPSAGGAKWIALGSQPERRACARGKRRSIIVTLTEAVVRAQSVLV
jgi:hypothetical protein